MRPSVNWVIISIITMFGFLSASVSADTVTLADGNTVELKGIGLAQELRTDIYIGALYAPVGVESLSIIKESTTPKRIAVKYLENNYSYRKVARHFKERIAMNNDRDVWQPATRDIVAFSRIFNQNFDRGDEIIMDFIPGKGTVVSLNNTEFEVISNPLFFELLLNAWTGPVPPSKSFKDGITAQTSDSERNSLLASFNSLTPVTGKFKAKAQVVAEAKPTPKAEKKEEPKKPVSQPKVVAEKPKVEAKPKEVESTLASQPKQESKKQAPVEKQVAETKPEPKNEVVAKLIIEAPKIAPVEVAEDLFDEDLVRGSYVRELIAQVNKNQEYPKKALINGEEGDGTAQVIINSNGELIEVSMSERTGSRELDKGILKIVKKSAPFPPIPPELKLSQFEFDVPFEFKL